MGGVTKGEGGSFLVVVVVVASKAVAALTAPFSPVEVSTESFPSSPEEAVVDDGSDRG